MNGADHVQSALDTVIHLDVILSAVHARQVPLAAETAGYLLVDLAGVCVSEYLAIEPSAIVVSEDGVVALVSAAESDEPRTEASLRAILGTLLAAGGSSTPALQAMVERPAEGAVASFVAELEAALIPLNRSAGRRAVARLAREARRVSMGIGRHGALAAPASLEKVPRPSTPPPPQALEEPTLPSAVQELLDATRDEPVRVEPLAPPPAAVAAVAAEAEGVSMREPPRIDIRDLPAPSVAQERPSYTSDLPSPPFVSPAVEESQEVTAIAPEAASLLAQAPQAPHPSQASAVGPAAPSGPLSLGGAPSSGALGADGDAADAGVDAAPVTTGSHSLRLAGLDGGIPSGELSFDPRVHTARIVTERADQSVQDARKSPWRLYAAGALALVAVGVAVGLKVAARGEGTGADAVVSAFRAGVASTKGACDASLTVEGIPLGAELFRRMGTAPIDVGRMPVGARLEWVALAEGFRVRRAVIPAGAAWNHGAAARYELAIQLDPSSGRGPEPWPAAEPGPQVGGAGSPGLVHIVTTPPGAEIFLFSGVAPEATLAALPCDESFDLLLAGPRDERRRIVVGSSEFVKTTDGTTGVEKRAARVRLDQR
jgi:hypothetical protein